MTVPADRNRAPREALLNGPALLIMSAVVVLALSVLFPRQPAFRDPANLRASDALSIAYLRVLVRSDPDNVPLRLSFVQLLTEAGNHPEAEQALAPLLAAPPAAYAFEIALAEIRLQLQQLFRAPDGANAAALRMLLEKGFHAALALAHQISEQDALLAEARKFGEPGVLAALYDTLLQRPDAVAARRGYLLSETAALHLAANQPQLAAVRWQEAVPLLPGGSAARTEATRACLRSYLAAGEGAAALQAARALISARETDTTLLTLAADVAQQNGDDLQTRSWLVRVYAQQPDDLALAERLLGLELAIGDLAAALPLAERVASQPNLSLQQQRLLARAFDWNGDGVRALPHWFVLAMQGADAEAETRAFALALALQDDVRLVQLVETVSNRRALQPEEARAYVERGLRVVEPQRLLQTLQRYVQRENKDRPAWVAIAHVQQASGEPLAALQAWQRAEQLAALKPAERLAIAEAYWRSDQPEPALNSLLPLSANPPVGDEARYWRLLAELAWALERASVARPAYSQVLARYAPNDKLAIDRLLQLAEQSGDRNAVERQALYGWSRLRAREYFVVLLDLAHSAGDVARVDQLLAEAQQQEARFAKEPRYWQFRAERAMARGDRTQARQALEKLAQLRANDPEVIEALLWLQLAEQPVPTAAINVLVERYASLAEADPVLAEAMAAAEQVLGRPAEAVRWYRQTLPARARDLPWLLTVADNLEWLGCQVTANQFRLRALQQLQQQPVPFPAVPHPTRLADHFFGRRYFAAAVAAGLDDSDMQDLVEQWALQQGLDNARWFALHWQQKRLQLSAWEDVADEWQEQNHEELARQLLSLQQALVLAPAGPLGADLLPLSLNDVAARARRFGGRAEPVVLDPASELPVCRQQLEQFSALALPLPAPLPAAVPTMVKP